MNHAILIAACLVLVAPSVAAAWPATAVPSGLVEAGRFTRVTGVAELDLAAGDKVELQLNATWAKTCINASGSTQPGFLNSTTLKVIGKGPLKHDAVTRTWGWNLTITPRTPTGDPCAIYPGFKATGRWELSASQDICSRVTFLTPRGMTALPPSSWSCRAA